MKLNWINVILIFTLAYMVYAQSTTKPDECVCDNSNNSSDYNLPYDPCKPMPKYFCSLLWESCFWDDNNSKCVFKYLPTAEKRKIISNVDNNKPEKNGTFPNIPGFEGLPDPCQRNPVYICLMMKEVCKWNSIKNSCHFRWFPH